MREDEAGQQEELLRDQEKNLGVSGFEGRHEARQRNKASNSFVLVHKVTEPVAVRPSAQLLPALPLPVQHLINSVAVSEELLPDLSGRRDISMPASSGAKIKCPSSTVQGKAQAGLLGHDSRPRQSATMRSDASKRKGKGHGKGVRVRKHLVMCALRGRKLDFWKSQQVPDVTRPTSGDAAQYLMPLVDPAAPYRGSIELTAASSVEVDRHGYELKLHIVFMSGDKTDAVTDTYTFLQAPDHVEPRLELSEIQEMLKEQIMALRSPSGKLVEYNTDPVNPRVKSVRSAPPLWEGPIQPAAFDDAPLLDGYIPHFLAEDAGRQRRMQPQTAALAAQFDRRKHQLWAALQKLKGTAAGTQESKDTVQDLLRRQLPDSTTGGAASRSVDGAGAGAGDFGNTLHAPEKPGGEELALQPELDFSQYRQDGDSSVVWDVEAGNGVIAIRHTTMGITLVLGSNQPTLACSIVSAGGDEFLFSGEGGLQSRALPDSQREVVLMFADRYVATAVSQVESGLGVALGGGWSVKHNWDAVATYGMWSLMSRTDSRCVAINAADPGGGVHLLANGFVIMGPKDAVLHLSTVQGPVGPVCIPHSQAVQVFADEEEDRPDAPHNVTAWRPLAQLNSNDIQQLRQEKSLLVKSQAMPPINLTAAGQPPFEWTVCIERDVAACSMPLHRQGRTGVLCRLLNGI